jgi:hypothetical protein
LNENEIQGRDMVKNPRALFLIAAAIFVVSIFVPWFHMRRSVFWIGWHYIYEDDYLWSFMMAKFMPQGYDTSVELWFLPTNTNSWDWFGRGDWTYQIAFAIYSRIGWLFFQILTVVSAIIVLFAGITWKMIVPIVALSSTTLILAIYHTIMLAEVLMTRINYSFGFGLAIVSILMFLISCYRYHQNRVNGILQSLPS